MRVQVGEDVDRGATDVVEVLREGVEVGDGRRSVGVGGGHGKRVSRVGDEGGAERQGNGGEAVGLAVGQVVGGWRIGHERVDVEKLVCQRFVVGGVVLGGDVGESARLHQVPDDIRRERVFAGRCVARNVVGEPEGLLSRRRHVRAGFEVLGEVRTAQCLRILVGAVELVHQPLLAHIERRERRRRRKP